MHLLAFPNLKDIIRLSYFLTDLASSCFELCTTSLLLFYEIFLHHERLLIRAIKPSMRAYLYLRFKLGPESLHRHFVVWVRRPHIPVIANMCISKQPLEDS